MPPRRTAPLRPLEVQFPRGPGGDVVLRDPLGLAPGPGLRQVVLGHAAWCLARRFDGRTGPVALAEEVGRELGQTISAQEALELGDRLSELLLLADERFEEALQGAFEDFRREPHRPARGAGGEYEADPFELRLRIGGLVADDWDMPPLPQAQGLWTPAGPLRPCGPLYSRAWASVRHLKGHLARLVVIGNAGAPFAHPLIPLAKPFAGPLGEVQPDREALATLGVLPGREQLVHRHHLGLERQMLFARVLFPGVPVVPLLASRLDGPGGEPAREEAAAALRRVLELPGRCLVVAAADLLRLGQPEPEGPDAGRMDPGEATRRAAALLGGARGRALRDHDRRAVDLAAALDAPGFLEHALGTEDPARLAAAAAPYFLLRALEGRGSLAEEGPLTGSSLGYLELPAPGELATAAAVVFH